MDTLFLLAIAWIAVHELDAIRQEEWRFFFGWTGMSDTNAYRLFTALHVPLFGLVFAAMDSRAFQIGFDLFLIVHVGLHWFLRKHPAVNFDSWFSWVWILGAGVLGALHLVGVWLG